MTVFYLTVVLFFSHSYRVCRAKTEHSGWGVCKKPFIISVQRGISGFNYKIDAVSVYG